MDMRLTPFQQELVETARRLATERFAPRAGALDREAAFPFRNNFLSGLKVRDEGARTC